MDYYMLRGFNAKPDLCSTTLHLDVMYLDVIVYHDDAAYIASK
jgi:hypothetical protein